MTFARLSATSFACVIAMAMAMAIGTACAEPSNSDKAADAKGTPTAPKIINQKPAKPEPSKSAASELVKAPPAVSKSPALATPTTKAAESAAAVDPKAHEKKAASPASEPAESKAAKTQEKTPPAKSAKADPKAQDAKPSSPPPKPTLVVDIDLTHQTLSVSERGQRIHTWKISSGREGYRTPTGNYRPQWMTKMWYSRKYEWSPMPHAIFFHKGYAIHGTYATRHLGAPASHGCVRLSPAHAATLYKLVTRHGKAKTRISLRGTAPSSKAAPQVAARRHHNRHDADRYRYRDDLADYDGYREERPRRGRTYRRRYSDGSTYAPDDGYYAPRRRYPPRYVERPYQRDDWDDYYD